MYTALSVIKPLQDHCYCIKWCLGSYHSY